MSALMPKLCCQAWMCFVQHVDMNALRSMLSLVVVTLLPLLRSAPAEVADVFKFLIVRCRLAVLYTCYRLGHARCIFIQHSWKTHNIAFYLYLAADCVHCHSLLRACWICSPKPISQLLFHRLLLKAGYKAISKAHCLLLKRNMLIVICFY